MTLPCTPVDQPTGRHDLVFVSPQGWRALFATRRDLAMDPMVARWPGQGWPAVRRRAMPGETSGVALGLPLPPSAGKRRIAFLLPPGDIISIVRPPSLEAACGSAPRAWWPTLDRLCELALRHSAEARVFGSLAWRSLTGLNYITDHSDLDLLLECRRDTDLERLVNEIAAVEADGPIRIDGELMRGDGAAVNWREFHAGAGEVLVKSVNRVGLLDRRHFICGKTIP